MQTNSTITLQRSKKKAAVVEEQGAGSVCVCAFFWKEGGGGGGLYKAETKYYPNLPSLSHIRPQYPPKVP